MNQSALLLFLYIRYHTEHCDITYSKLHVLVMTVHPGFGGQSFIHEAAEKIKPIRQIVGPDIRVEVDGGIDPKTTPTVTALGADTLVAGNAIFGQKDRGAAINAIKNAIAQ